MKLLLTLIALPLIAAEVIEACLEMLPGVVVGLGVAGMIWAVLGSL